ncbi:MAG: cytochrome bc complex cytochrome b subunit, partial [Desulfobacterales bacterium]|nr:cytochrome bc complex cytochrome b subunit [Desulfobacterales bacterium]
MSRIRFFLSDRLGWPEHLKPFMEKPLPADAGWTTTFGSLLALLFVVEAVTGMFLAFYYNPSPDLAYQAVGFIMRDVFGGQILRGIHHFGASAMVILVFAHMAASFFYGAFKAPRELTWILGVCLFLLTLGFGFTGYLLPWDQKAYWATVVGTNIPRDIPLVGEFITRILLGGESVSGLTLTRFYAIHTLILPALTAGCIGIHIYLVRIHGISEPAPAPAPQPPADPPYRFFPEHLARAAAAFSLVFLVLILLAFFAEIPMQDVAGTIDPTYLPRPEWYYMWLFQLLTFFSGSTEIIGSLVIPLGGVSLVFCLPFLSRSPLKNLAARPTETALGVACLVGIAYLSIMGIANSRPYGETVRIPDRSLSPSEKAGLSLFVDRECAYCH